MFRSPFVAGKAGLFRSSLQGRCDAGESRFATTNPWQWRILAIRG